MGGGCGVVVDIVIFYLLASPSVLGWNITASKVCSAEGAMVNNFLWNDRWTFKKDHSEKGIASKLGRFARFNLICSVGILLSVLLLHIQVFTLNANLWIANVVSISLTSLWNFGMSTRIRAWT